MGGKKTGEGDYTRNFNDVFKLLYWNMQMLDYSTSCLTQMGWIHQPPQWNHDVTTLHYVFCFVCFFRKSTQQMWFWLQVIYVHACDLFSVCNHWIKLLYKGKQFSLLTTPQLLYSMTVNNVPIKHSLPRHGRKDRQACECQLVLKLNLPLYLS